MSKDAAHRSSRKKLAEVGLAGLALLGIGYAGGTWLQRPNPPEILSSAEGESSIQIEVRGAVNNPGVFNLKRGTRVEDVIKEAGGLKPDAQIQYLNRSAFLIDAVPLSIPSIGDPQSSLINSPYSIQATPVPQTGQTIAAGGVSLNRATSQELQQLKGIGEKLAQRIITYRTQNGGFRSIEEIKEVRGIGDKTFEKLRPFLRL